MKEHFQDFGVRKWAGDDLIELQAEPLAALQTLVAPYAPCILQGCEMETVSDGSGGTTYRLHAGLAALKGVDAAGNACVKIVRVEEEPWTTDTVYLSLKCEQKSRTYADGNNKVIANEYKAALSATQSDDALKISATAGGPRLVDTLGITQKLNTVGGNARDVVVTFVESMEDNRPELKSGSSLGLLLQQIRKWFDELKDLKALAFKAKVAKGDLTEELARELDGKVKQEGNKVLSECDFTQILKDKLDGIPGDANNYVHPTYPPKSSGLYKITVNSSGHVSGTTAVAKSDITALGIPGQDTVYTHPTHVSKSSGLYKITVDSSGHVSGAATVSKSDITALGIPSADTTYSIATATSNGLMSSSDKSKLNGIATGANNYTHPTSAGNKHIPSGGSSGQFLKWSSSGTATWGSVETVNHVGSKSSCTVSLSPGDLVRIANDNVTISVATATLEQISKNNVAYVSNSGWKVSRITAGSRVTLMISDAAKNIIGTTKMGLWRITWHGTEAAFVEFIQCDGYIPS